MCALILSDQLAHRCTHLQNACQVLLETFRRVSHKAVHQLGSLKKPVFFLHCYCSLSLMLRLLMSLSSKQLGEVLSLPLLTVLWSEYVPRTLCPAVPVFLNLHRTDRRASCIFLTTSGQLDLDTVISVLPFHKFPRILPSVSGLLLGLLLKIACFPWAPISCQVPQTTRAQTLSKRLYKKWAPFFSFFPPLYSTSYSQYSLPYKVQHWNPCAYKLLGVDPGQTPSRPCISVHKHQMLSYYDCYFRFVILEWAKSNCSWNRNSPQAALISRKKKKKCSIVKGLISLRINLPIFPQIPSGTDGPLVAQ